MIVKSYTERDEKLQAALKRFQGDVADLRNDYKERIRQILAEIDRDKLKRIKQQLAS